MHHALPIPRRQELFDTQVVCLMTRHHLPRHHALLIPRRQEIFDTQVVFSMTRHHLPTHHALPIHRVVQIADLRLTLWCLGVKVRENCCMLGDNKSVVDSSTKPHAKPHKRHAALSFHRARKAAASRFVSFSFVDGSSNPADIMSKHWGCQQVWKHVLKPILLFHGDAAEPHDDEQLSA